MADLHDVKINWSHTILNCCICYAQMGLPHYNTDTPRKFEDQEDDSWACFVVFKQNKPEYLNFFPFAV